MDTKTIALALDSPKTAGQSMQATATVTQGGQFVNSGQVDFTILGGDAVFDDTKTQSTSRMLDSFGEAQAGLSSAGATTGSVKAALHEAPSVNNTQDYTFLASGSGYALSPFSIDDGNAFADGMSTVQASIYLSKDGVPQKGMAVDFVLNDCSALFPDLTGIAHGTTDENGKAGVIFRDSKAEEGFITASLTNLKEIRKQGTFTFRPVPALAFGPPTVDGQPADGQSSNTVTATVSDRATGAPMAGVTVLFTLPDWAWFDAGARNSTTSAVTNAQGQCRVSFQSTRAAGGKIQAAIKNNQAYSAAQDFSFSSAWAKVGQNYSILFQDRLSGTDTVYLFSNGQHQTILNIGFDMLDAFGNRLTDDNAPQPDYVQQNVILIDYASQTPLGTGAFSAFTVSTAPGPFAVNPSPSPLAPSALAPTGAGPEHGGFDTCTVSNGYAWLTFYLSCDGSFSSANGTLSIGAKITPNGRDAIYDSRDGTIRQSATVTVTDGHSYGASSIELTGAQLNPGIDNGPQTIVGSEAPENCWRLYNYKLRLSAAGNTVLQACGARLYQWRFANAADRMALWNTDSALQYAFATQRFGGLYGLKAYFWPMNVRDETGALTGTSKQTAFTLQADGCTPRPINFDNANDLYISLYCTFGGIRPDPAVSRSVNFVFYDQFGNSGRCRLQTLLPLAYSANDLLGFRFLLDGNGGVLAAPVPRPANPPVSILGTPVLIQGSSVVHGPAAALGQMHNDGDFPTLYGTDIAVLQNGIDWSLDPQNADEATYSEAYYYAIAGNGNYLQAIPKPNYPIPYSSAASKAEFWYFKPIWSKSAVVVTDSNGNAWSGINIKGSKSASSGYPALTTTLLKAGYTSIADTMTFTLK